MENFMVRASLVVTDKMDASIAAGEFASRSDYARHAIQYYQNRQEFQQDLRGAITGMITEGWLDEVLEKRLRRIWQKIATESPG